ncbi:Rv1733c family protein [Nocardia brasiliensis]|uniref:Rv1733c family protein n=2 Tax=Nocardia brasiliensis TaxID=37326 RepID=UPI002457FC9C|nr:hypothetical protein [Nocardia brasiliensis]
MLDSISAAQSNGGPLRRMIQMSDYPSLPVRAWRMRPWQKNVLFRPTDRLLALVWMMAVVAMLAAVPVAGAVGTAGYTSAAARISAENAPKTAVPGTITADPERTVSTSGRGESAAERAEAPVQWMRDGRTGTATVEVASDAKRGEQVSIWLDSDAALTSPPRSSGVAAGEGATRGLLVVLGCWGAALALVAITGRTVTTRHSARWDREWRDLDRPIGTDT